MRISVNQSSNDTCLFSFIHRGERMRWMILVIGWMEFAEACKNNYKYAYYLAKNWMLYLWQPNNWIRIWIKYVKIIQNVRWLCMEYKAQRKKHTQIDCQQNPTWSKYMCCILCRYYSCKQTMLLPISPNRIYFIYTRIVEESTKAKVEMQTETVEEWQQEKTVN